MTFYRQSCGAGLDKEIVNIGSMTLNVLVYIVVICFFFPSSKQWVYQYYSTIGELYTCNQQFIFMIKLLRFRLKPRNIEFIIH